jgi:protein-S-isoprenylcysteine O-methyltransferase Ste14
MTALALARMAFGGTLLYLGLAILGRGGFAAFFSHLSLMALSIIVLVMAGMSAFSSGNLSAGEREDRSNRWVLWDCWCPRWARRWRQVRHRRAAGGAHPRAGDRAKYRRRSWLLQAQFGAEYAAYLSRTFRLVPGIY